MLKKNLISEPLPKLLLLLLHLLSDYLNIKGLEMLKKNLIPEPLPKLLLLYILSYCSEDLKMLKKNLIPEPLPKLLLLYLLLLSDYPEDLGISQKKNLLELFPEQLLLLYV